MPALGHSQANTRPVEYEAPDKRERVVLRAIVTVLVAIAFAVVAIGFGLWGLYWVISHLIGFLLDGLD